MPHRYRSYWALDPALTYLNHGSFGACPRAVLERQTALRAELERDPVEFLSVTLPARLAEALGTLAAFLGAAADDLAFVSNATQGVNTVLRSLPFAPGDEILVTSQTYAACRKAVDHICATTGAVAVCAPLPFPVDGPEALVAPILAAVTPRTRLALIDHVTSPTALVLPLARIVAELAARGVDTLVDGAHAPGMVPLALDAIGAAYYTGNAHKWLCAPKGAAFLHVRRDRQPGLHPLVISHGYGRGFRAEFDWTGTADPTAWLAVPAALEHLGALCDGGWPALMAHNRALALEARAIVLERLGLEPPCPEELIGSMASVPLPKAAPGSPAARLGHEALVAWFRERGVRTWIYPDPVPLVRLSAQLYNDADDYRLLAERLCEALLGG